MPRPRPLTLNIGSGNGSGATIVDRPDPHSNSNSNSSKGAIPVPPAAPNSPNSSHGNSATPMPTPPPSHGHRSHSRQGEIIQQPGALYDPFGFKPKLPSTDLLSQKWAYQARHLMRAQQALVAAQNEVLRIEQDLLWTEREMFEKERRLAEKGELPEDDNIGGDGVIVDKSDKSGGSGKPSRQTQPPRAANANYPKRYSSDHQMYMPGQFPSPTNGNPSDKLVKQIAAGGKDPAESKSKSFPLKMSPYSHMRHSYHPGIPIRSNSITSDSSHDSDAKTIHAAEKERIQQAKHRQEYEKLYGSRSSSRGYALEAEMRRTLGGDFGSPTSEEEDEDEGYGYDRYYPGQYTEALNASKKEKRRPEMLNMKSSGSGYVDKWVHGSGGGGGGGGGRSGDRSRWL